jgi:hypothetical protein
MVGGKPRKGKKTSPTSRLFFSKGGVKKKMKKQVPLNYAPRYFFLGIK